ncbi:MAG: hypothetical protein JXR88_05020 [Clostridia bacterium]|nr:hypothetical protein [Clostridia bacterium]
MKKNSAYLHLFVACCFILSGVLQWSTTKWAALLNFVTALIWVVTFILLKNKKKADFSKVQEDEIFMSPLKSEEMNK